MKDKMNKSKTKGDAKFVCVRIRASTKERASLLLEAANKKKHGCKIKFEDLVEIAFGLVADEHLKLLQERSLSNEDRKERLREKYIAIHGPISRDAFIGYMMTVEFQNFLNEQSATDISGIIGTRISA